MNKLLRLLSCLSIAAITGCANLQSKIESKIHPGDSYTQVRTALGKPPYMEQTENGGIIGYVDAKDFCAIYLNNHHYVVNWECWQNANYVNPWAHIGDGLIYKTHCTTTDGGGGYYYTNCH